MKYLHLIWAALFRRKLRTFLTLVSIITAFLLFGLLDAVRVGFDQAGKSANGAQRLQTGAKLSFIQPDMAACSVIVRVSWSELAEISSMALSTRSAWLTSFTRVTYQPTWPWFQGVVSSKYFQLKRNIWSHQPAALRSATWITPTILKLQLLLPARSGKMVEIMGTVSPTFQPKRRARPSPTMAPSLVSAKALQIGRAHV